MFQFVSFAWKPYQFQSQSRPCLLDSIFAMNFLFLFAICSPFAICFFLPVQAISFSFCESFLFPPYSPCLSFSFNFFLLLHFISFSFCILFIFPYAGHFLFLLIVHTILIFHSLLSHFSFHFFLVFHFTSFLFFNSVLSPFCSFRFHLQFIPFIIFN